MPAEAASTGTGIIVDWFLEAVATVDGVAYVGTYSRTLEKAHAWGEPRGASLFFDSLCIGDGPFRTFCAKRTVPNAHQSVSREAEGNRPTLC